MPYLLHTEANAARIPKGVGKEAGISTRLLVASHKPGLCTWLPGSPSASQAAIVYPNTTQGDSTYNCPGELIGLRYGYVSFFCGLPRGAPCAASLRAGLECGAGAQRAPPSGEEGAVRCPLRPACGGGLPV